MASKKCNHTTNKGDPCGAWSQYSDGACLMHSTVPEAVAARSSGRQKGAKLTAERAITTVKIPELDLGDIKSAEDTVMRVYDTLLSTLDGMKFSAEVARVMGDVAAKMDRAAERRHEAMLQERIPFRLVWDDDSPTCQHCGGLLADPPK